MATKTAGADPAGVVTEHLTLDDRVALLRYMLLMRGIEERAMNLYRQGKVPGSFYDGFGQEAVSVGSTFAMSAQDRLCILHRDLGGHLVRGEVAVQDAEAVPRRHGPRRTGGHGLLAEAVVERAGHLALAVQVHRALLDAPHEEHVAQERDAVVERQVLGYGARRVGARGLGCHQACCSLRGRGPARDRRA
jgi:hypothetical protein